MWCTFRKRFTAVLGGKDTCVVYIQETFHSLLGRKGYTCGVHSGKISLPFWEERTLLHLPSCSDTGYCQNSSDDVLQHGLNFVQGKPLAEALYQALVWTANTGCMVKSQGRN